ncbi:diguanylate cyclase [Sulfurimonas lithotrophica]|uniref:diguanylate cyclase n=1 Tax=Sulfurimonas lithotrophica TaxID=2590022 RepID=A0A5P8P2S5_9BACT|nr:diguanylate cyclase [Sulfurimonas lithotrophica]QFR50022.1 diguanylate cyclase [Sulfurimonas lithotrophica]
MIEWNEGLNLGIKTLDNDHKQLLHIVSKLSKAIDANETIDVIENIFNELEDCTDKHFKKEEDYLKDCNCRDLDKHILHHRDFSQRLSQLKMQTLSLPAESISHDITIYLTEWILNHVIEEDIPSITFFKQCGLTLEAEKSSKTLLQRLIKATTDRFSFTKRIFLSAIIPLSGMLLFGTIIIFVNFNEFLNMKNTSKVTHITSDVSELVHNLQIERGLNSGYLTSTDNKFKDRLTNQRKLVDNAVLKITKKIKNIHINNLKTIKPHIDTLKKDILSLKEIRQKINNKTISQIDGINIYSQIIKNILNITPKIATLNLNNNLSSSIKTLASIQQFKEALGQERAYGTTIIEKKDLTMKEYTSFAKLLGVQKASLITFGYTASSEQKNILDSLINSNSAKRVEFYEQKIKEQSFDTIDSENWFKAITKYINEIKVFEDTLLTEVKTLISDNIDSTIRNFLLWLVFNTSILAINLFILYTFKKSTVVQIDELTNAMKDLATGGRAFILSPINMNRDEIAYMYDAYETTRQKLLKGDMYTQLYESKNEIELKKREKENKKLEKIAFTDSLTGTLNRRKFEKVARQEIERSNRYNSKLSFLMIDIDHFKRVNDTYGHAVGDEVIKHFASACMKMLRNIDVVARIGGEEFVVMLPETTVEGAYKFAERFRKQIYASELNINEKSIRFSISIGVSTLNKNEDLKTVLQKADKALYRAKESGRNRSVINK